MTLQTKVKYLVLAVSVLLILNVTIIATIYAKSVNISSNTQESDTMSDTIDYNNHFFTYYLSFSPEQIQQFKEINQKYITQKSDIGREIGTENIMLSKMINDGLSREQEQPFYDKIIELHMDLRQAYYTYYLCIRDICDSSQQLLLDNFFKSTLYTNTNIEEKQ